MFDYGHEKNLKRYGQEKPPVYDLSNIKIPVALFVGKTDGITSKEDYLDLIKDIPPEHLLTFQELPFGHSGFLVAKDMQYLDLIESFF